MVARLPQPGGDEGTWGTVLNDFLAQAHDSDGSLKANSVDATALAPDAVGSTNIQDGSVDTAKLATTASPSSGQVLTYSGTNLNWSTPSGSGSVPDADSTTKGLVRLTGDLGGTAATPTVPALSGKEPTITAGSTAQYWRGDKSWQTLNKSAVGLGNVDNTADASKPVSSAAQTALNAKADDSAVVHNTGAETVAGIKTFSASPIVPTPGSGTQAANKSYVDSAVTGGAAADATTGSKGIVQLAGDLSGTAASPTIATGAVTSAKIADGTIVDADVSGSAAIAQSKVSGLTTSLSGKAASGANSDITSLSGLSTPLSAAQGGTGNSSGKALVDVAKAGTTTGTRSKVNFIEGSNVTITTADNSGSGQVDVTIAAASGGGSLTVQDEGSTLTSAATSVNFVGSGVTANNTSGAVTVTIPDTPVETVNTVGTSGSSQTIPDVTSSTISVITLTANCTLTFPTASAGKSFTLVLQQDATGSRTVTWPAGVKWPGGVAPTLTTTASAVDYITFLCPATSWNGFLSGSDMK